MRILLLLFILPILLLACALFTLWIPLPHPFPAALSSERNLLSAIATGILGLGYLIGLAVYVLSSFLQAGCILDPVLVPSGLISESYMVFGRQYRGAIEGRQVEISFLPPQGIRPALLNVYVSADLGARMAIGRQKPLLDCADCPHVEIEGTVLGQVEVYAQEEECARSLLGDATSVAALNRLMLDQETLGFHEIYWQPDRIWFRAHPRWGMEDQFQQWLEILLELAGASERMFECVAP
jgi:hypothetical protein